MGLPGSSWCSMANTIDILASDGRVITIPDFDFAGFYYPEILPALLEYNRVNASELTSEDPREPHVQLLRSFSLVGHLSNTRMDVVANENLLESAQLRESVRRLFDLIAVQLASAKPATAELIMALTTIITSDVSIFIAEDSAFASVPDEDGSFVEFEALQDLPLKRGDRIGYVFAEEHRVGGADGQVDSSTPTRFTSVITTFLAADVGRRLLVTNSQNRNGGVFEITNFIDANNIEVSGASFVTETGLLFALTEFSVNFESAANDGITSFPPFTDIAQSFLYIGHDDLVWEQIDFTMTNPAAGFRGVWEYFDPEFSNANPNSIVDLGGTIEAVVDSLIGAEQNFEGGIILTITYNLTGVSEQLAPTWDGFNNKVTTRGFLGMTVFDPNPLNYTITTDWIPLVNQVDGSVDFSTDGALTFNLPKTRSARWTKATVNGVEAYFLRFRFIEVTGPVIQPEFLEIEIDQGRQFFPFNATQGETIREELLGSSNGLADQEFIFLRGPLFDDTQIVQVDETGAQNFVTWTPVVRFLNSRATDRHYKIRTDEDGLATIKFGNGIKGRIPPLFTDNIRVLEYRIGGELDGNVGFDEITEDQAGIPFSSFVTNPMAATGWKDKEGGTPEDLERVKEAGPAEIHGDKAIATSDAARLAVDEFQTSTGSAPVARAFGIEEAFGPKTIQLIVVGSGGGFLTVGELEELDTFFNGDQFAVPPVDGLIVIGHELTSVNYTPRVIDVDVIVTAKGITVNQIRNAIIAHMNPLNTDTEGNFVHKFGGVFAVVLLDCAISDVGGGKISNIVRTTPTIDVPLGPLELPVVGTITVTIVEG